MMRQAPPEPARAMALGVLDEPLLHGTADDLLICHAGSRRPRAVIEQLGELIVAEYQPVLGVIQGEAFRDRFYGVGDALAGLLGCLLGGLARRDVAPRAHHLDRMAVGVLDQMLLVAHPAIGAVALAEAIFRGVPAFFE